MTSLRILHLSDVHATSAGLLHGSVDGVARLRRVAAYAAAARLAPDLLLVTGDLVEKADAAAYPPVAEALAGLSRSLGVPVLTVLGNHDRREAAATTLPDHAAGHYGAHEIGGWRIVRLDSSTAKLGEEQLDWLAAELARPSEHGTVLGMHHSPVESPLASMRGRGLADAPELARVITGTDVRIILCGHYHHAQGAMFHDVPVWTGPALSYQQIMDAGPGLVQGADDGQLSLVTLGPTGYSATPYQLAPARTPLFTLSVGNVTTTPEPASSRHAAERHRGSRSTASTQ